MEEKQQLASWPACLVNRLFLKSTLIFKKTRQRATETDTSRWAVSLSTPYFNKTGLSTLRH